MIARLALSPEALRSLSEGGSPAEIFGRHSALLEAIEAHGFLVFGATVDSSQLVAAINAAGPEAAQKWTHLMKRFGRSGRFMKLNPPSPAGIDELTCVAELRAGWAPNTDVAIVSGEHAAAFGIPADAMSHVDQASGIESSLAPAAPFVGTLARYKGTRNKQVLKQGARRDDLWNDALLPIARVATRINIVDRYLFKHLANLRARGKADESFVAWVLDALDREARTGCEVSLIGYDCRPNGEPRNADAAAELVASVFPGSGDRIRSVDVVTAQPASYLPHDRHISTNLNVGVTFLESFDSLDGDTVASQEGVEYSYRFDPDAIEKLQMSERRFEEDRSAPRVVAFRR